MPDLGVPGGLVILERWAVAHGWSANRAYPSGVVLATNRTGRPSWSLRVQRGDERAYGVWIGGKFDNAGHCVVGVEGSARVGFNSTELRRILAVTETDSGESDDADG